MFNFSAGLPRQRDPDAADRVMKRVIGGLGRIRYRSYVSFFHFFIHYM